MAPVSSRFFDRGTSDDAEQELAKAVDLFRVAAARKGAYAEQAAAATAAVEASRHVANPRAVGAALESLVAEVGRLLTNVGCRITTKSDRIVREAARAELNAARRAARERLSRARGYLDGPPAADSSGSPSAGQADDLPAYASRAQTLDALRLECPSFRATGSPRHLCGHLCYFREYEGARRVRELRDSLGRRGAEGRAREWEAELRVREDRGRVRGARVLPWSTVLVHRPTGSESETVAGAVRAVGLGPARAEAPAEAREGTMVTPGAERRAAGLEEAPASDGTPRKRRRRTLSPHFARAAAPASVPEGARALAPARACPAPESPYGLLEEILQDDPWKLLVACALLNQTSRLQVDKVAWAFFRRYPTAEALARAPAKEVGGLLLPLGLHNRRAAQLVRFSQEYLRRGWSCPSELHGVGQYAADAHAVFVLRDFTVRPNDHALNWYCDWVRGREAEAASL